MVRIGSITLDAPFFQAGLAGYSDAAMRLVARRHGCPYCVTEAMLDQFLIQGGKGVRAAELRDEDHPIAGQLMGSHPQDIADGARVLIGLGYDVVDVNLACPVRKIRRKCRGGHLLSVPDEAIAILDAVAQSVAGEVPCTVKLRRGTDDSPEAAAAFERIFEAARRLGYAGAVVHGRTVVQKYLGPSSWPFLRKLVDQYGCSDGFVIGGSGDVWTASDIERMRSEAGVELVSVARGCIGNPWLFAQARALANGDPDAAARPPTIHQQRDVLREHFELSMSLHGQRRAGMLMRKFGIKFSLHHPRAEQVKRAFISVASLEDWRAVLETWFEQDGPGRPADVELAHTGEADGI
ncbi:MAG: tRNA-dihydrouridine synthase [Phycisphaeraceae bacterium]|nr:tRNA-dihydrouridine synthase [Phycisphaeraceae bacterium]